MRCQACGREIAPGDRFCNGCGVALTPDAVVDDDATDAVVQAEPAAAVDPPADHGDDRTELLPITGDGSDDDWGDDDPVWAATGAVPATPAATGTASLPATEPITPIVTRPAGGVSDVSAAWPVAEERPAPGTPYDFVERETGTGRVPVTSTVEMPVAVAVPAGERGRFRPVALVWLGLATAAVTLVGLFATVVAVTTDDRIVRTEDTPPAFRTGTWIADDLADNLSLAGLLAVVAIVAGGVAAGFGWRWGSGLAGGAGLALTGLAALAIGLAQIPIDAAHEFARIPTENQFTLTITRDLGYWLLLVAAALGIVLFFTSLNDAGSDRRAGLNPWIAALGALAAVVAAVGPMLPDQRAVFSDNWYLIDGPGQVPAMLLVGRLVQLGLLVVAGVVGFLSVRRWGLGVAIGGSLPVLWMAVSTLFELTNRPVGPGYRNPGATDAELHGVTIIGVSALLAMAVLALIAAYDQSVRERP